MRERVSNMEKEGGREGGKEEEIPRERNVGTGISIKLIIVDVFLNDMCIMHSSALLRTPCIFTHLYLC